MKKLILTLKLLTISLILIATPAQNSSSVGVSFTFDFASNPDLANFYLYYGTGSSNYTSRISIGTATSYVLSGLNRNTLYYFNVTANSTNGVEGDYTTESSCQTFRKPGKAQGFSSTAQ